MSRGSSRSGSSAVKNTRSGVPAAGLAYALNTGGGTLAGHADDHGDELIGVVLFQGLQHRLAADAVVHIVDEDLQACALHHIRPARHHQMLQSGGDNGGVAAHVPAHGNGREGILDIEKAVHPHLINVLAAGGLFCDGEGIAPGSFCTFEAV